MASSIVTAFVASALMVPAPSAQMSAGNEIAPQAQIVQAAAGCDRAVAKALQMTGGELLSVQAAKNGKMVCRVTVLVVKANGRPKKVQLRIPVDY